MQMMVRASRRAAIRSPRTTRLCDRSSIGSCAGTLAQGWAAQQRLNPGGKDGAKGADGENLLRPANARGMQQVPEVSAAEDCDQRGAHLRAKKPVRRCAGSPRQGESAAGPKHTS